MKIIVDSQQTLNVLVAVLNAACANGMQMAKTAIVLAEATIIQEPTGEIEGTDDEEPKT